MGHVLGYRHLTAYADTNGSTHSCVMTISGFDPLNHDICVHERQLAFWRYGERDSINLYYPMITGFPDTFDLHVDTLDLGDSTWVHVVFSQEPDTPVVASSEPLAWSIDDTTKARITAQDGDSVLIRAFNPGTTTLRLEVEPDLHVSWDASGAFSATAEITVIGTSPFACFTLEADSTWLWTEQYLDASCADQGAALRYSWQFESGGGWTSPSTSTFYDLEGHGTDGTMEVTLRVTDTSTQVYGDTTIVVRVFDDQLTVWGDQAIPVKTTYVYETNDDHAGSWWERYPPSLDWDVDVGNYTDSITRIWPGGEYTVDLRAEDTLSHVLRRGKLAITVCTVTQSCAQKMADGSPAGTNTMFGGGPLVAWREGGKPHALQFYQLMGMHTVRTAFVSREWFELARGSVRNEPWPGDISWRRTESKGVVAWEFSVNPPAMGEYVFGFALDPDLGDEVADDASGYDSVSGMVYASDAEGAVGFLLRDGGSNALASVEQYGTTRFAPASPQRTWDAVRSPGVNLLNGKSDVQFLLAAGPATGKASYRLLLVEAEDTAELIAKARSIK